MLTECLENKEGYFLRSNPGPRNSLESLFMAPMFQQQKMIRKLIERLKAD